MNEPNRFQRALNERAWCKTHPTAYIGRDSGGKWYEKCTYGYKEEKVYGKVSSCSIIIEAKDGSYIIH